MKERRIEKGRYTLTCLIPRREPEEIIYLHSPSADLRLPEDLLEEAGAVCVSVSGEDWNGDLTPWPARKVFARGEDFAGRGEEYLAELTGELMPLAEKELGAEGLRRGIAGVSLSGLFAVYAACRTDLFKKICSISGSLWYDGFLDYLKSHPASSAVRRAYFSVGSREKNTRNPRMSRVEECTAKAEALLREQGVDTCFEINPGSHFADGEERLRKGLGFILSAKKL